MASLVLLKSPAGASVGQVIPLDGDELVVGREPELCQIVIPHHAVSRQHARITRADGQYFIEDLKSRNHTFVNSKEVTDRTPLRHDDRIKVCDFLFRFHDPSLDRVRPPAFRSDTTWMSGCWSPGRSRCRTTWPRTRCGSGPSPPRRRPPTCTRSG
ncbi:MAG: FHA domain-containing protein [Gemmataceae bacterium]|nr:FHA domain-containing protein [Gemmataceae bacterium]